MPSREIAAILTYDLPKSKQAAAYKIDASLYMDRKNKPSEKTSLSTTGDINVDKSSVSINGETKFSYPTQSKVKYIVQFLPNFCTRFLRNFLNFHILKFFNSEISRFIIF